MGYVMRGGSDGRAVLARIDTPQDVYEAVNLLHTDCIDELGEDHPVTEAMAEALTNVHLAYTSGLAGYACDCTRQDGDGHEPGCLNSWAQRRSRGG